ncbi:hypothetical protein G6F43_001611 [Rhizopus delemar]|nr:hypothetical protein G6F43_001611 [Rhizopus delemar]
MKMEVDEVSYPLDDVTNFDQYSDFKTAGNMQQDKKEVPEEKLSSLIVNYDTASNDKVAYDPVRMRRFY